MTPCIFKLPTGWLLPSSIPGPALRLARQRLAATRAHCAIRPTGPSGSALLLPQAPCPPDPGPTSRAARRTTSPPCQAPTLSTAPIARHDSLLARAARLRSMQGNAGARGGAGLRQHGRRDVTGGGQETRDAKKKQAGAESRARGNGEIAQGSSVQAEGV